MEVDFNKYPDDELFNRVRELIYSCIDNGDKKIFDELDEIINKHYPELKTIEKINKLRL